MTKIELITALVQKGQCTRKQADEALSLVTSVLIDALVQGEKVRYIRWQEDP